MNTYEMAYWGYRGKLLDVELILPSAGYTSYQRGFNLDVGMVYGDVVTGAFLLNYIAPSNPQDFDPDLGKLFGMVVYSNLEYIIPMTSDAHNPEFKYAAIKRHYCPEKKYTEPFYYVLRTSITQAVGYRCFGYDGSGGGPATLIYEGDIVAPHDNQLGVIGIVKKRIDVSGSPYQVNIKPNPTFNYWPTWVDLDDFQWDIIGNLWETPELLGDWNGLAVKDDWGGEDL